ncbi:hypothetical protein DK37_03710 [Halomonas sp. SUBG004]|nr:hypothetical protein DK37_03710 [Halomonas sp. SUBG004]
MVEAGRPAHHRTVLDHVAISVLCHSILYLPPAMGMMFGLGLLQFFGYYLRRSLPPFAGAQNVSVTPAAEIGKSWSS